MGYNNQLATYNTGEFYTWEQADGILTGRNKTSKKLANNTYLIRGDNEIHVKLHDTNIVTIHNDGTYQINSGGWLTVTTKDRINRFSPASISQRAGIWYLGDGSLFYDGMFIDGNGQPLTPREPGEYESKLKSIKKDARKYARDFVQALKAGAVDMPSGGDCWYCSMRTEDGQPLGDATRNGDHIREHIREGYFVPSLLVNAGRDAGYQDFQMGMMGIGGQRLFIDPENNIYKYVVKQLQKEI